MPINDPIPPTVYEEHSERIDWSDYVFVWDRLSDFWDLIDNKGLVTAFWEGWDHLNNKIIDYLERHRYDHTLISPFYWGGSEPYPFEIELSSENRVPGTSHSYYINPIKSYDPDGNLSKTEFVLNITVVQDFIQEPTLIYQTGSEAGAITFTTDIHNGDQGILTFHDANYMTSDRVWGDGKYRMWVTGWRAKSRDDIAERFGPFVGYGDRLPVTCEFNGSTIEHAKNEIGTLMDITGLFYAQEFGPVIPNLEIGLYMTNEWPYSPLDGTIYSINGTDSITIEFEDKTLYEIENITGLAFQTRTEAGWVDLQVGDSIYGMAPLVHGLDIEDIFTDPWYWKNLPIGWAERWHTFAVLFNGELFCDGTSSGFPIDCTATMSFLSRNKPIGDKPFVMVLLDEIPVVTSHTSWVPLLGDLLGSVLDYSGFWDLNNTIDGVIANTNAFTISDTIQLFESPYDVVDFTNWYGSLISAPIGISMEGTNHVGSSVSRVKVTTGDGWTSYGYTFC